MTHAFMYPRVTQIAPRAHTVPASSLGMRMQPGTRDVSGGPLASSSGGDRRVGDPAGGTALLGSANGA
jgi:hypothetical protein